VHDCIVIGAGPGGLTAATYLRRFHRDVQVLDGGQSRAQWIPKSHNCPGFPDGVSGEELLRRLREQAAGYGVRLTRSRAVTLQCIDGGFEIGDESGGNLRARTVLLATGIVDELPDVPWIERALGCTAVRLCPICDAYEAAGTRIAMYGPAAKILSHALFLRTYTAHVLIAPSDDVALSDEELKTAKAAGIAVLPGPVRLDFDGHRCSCSDADGGVHHVDVVYPVLGSRSQSSLATRVGAKVDDNGELIVSPHQMTSVDGLYAIGDVVSALNQIAVALGHAAIAATAIHNRLPRNLAQG
jgi:thioredoxin reductase (NADPH)